MTEKNDFNLPSFLRSRAGLVLLVFLAIAGFFLWQEHEAHIAGALPLILLLGACVGMHFFMHGGHGHGGGHDNSSGRSDRRTRDDER